MEDEDEDEDEDASCNGIGWDDFVDAYDENVATGEKRGRAETYVSVSSHCLSPGAHAYAPVRCLGYLAYLFPARLPQRDAMGRRSPPMDQQRALRAMWDNPGV